MSYKQKHKGAEPKTAGAPCKLTASAQKVIIAALETGATYKLAANCAGLSYISIRDWIKIGEDDEVDGKSTKFSDFSKLVKQTVSKFACKKLKSIDIDEQWQAAAWLLERRLPDDFGRHTQIDLQTQENLDFSSMSEQEILAFFNKLTFKNKTAIVKAFLADHEKDLQAQGEK